MIDKNAVISKIMELITKKDYFSETRDIKFTEIGEKTIEKFIAYMKQKNFSVEEDETDIIAIKGDEKVLLCDPKMESGRYFAVASYINANKKFAVKMEVTTVDKADLLVNKIMFKGYNLLDRKELDKAVQNFPEEDYLKIMELANEYENTLKHMENNEFIFLDFDGKTIYNDINKAFSLCVE